MDFGTLRSAGWQLSAQAHHPAPEADREVGAPVGVASLGTVHVRIQQEIHDLSRVQMSG